MCWVRATNFYRGTSGIANKHTGSYGYAISNTSYGYNRSDQVPVTGSTAYDVYGWLRGKVDADSSYSTNWIIRVRWYNSQGTYLSYTNADYGPGSELTTTWQHLGGRVTAPANAAKATVDLYFFNVPAGLPSTTSPSSPHPAAPTCLTIPGSRTVTDGPRYVSSLLGKSTSHWRGDWAIAEPHDQAPMPM